MNTVIYAIELPDMSQGGDINYSTEENPEIRHQIRSFHNLAQGWHYGEGRGATDCAVVEALAVYNYFLEYKVKTIEVFPDIDGGILVSGYYKQHTLDVLCTHDGYINLLHEVDDEEFTEKEKISRDEFAAYLGGLLWETENLFGFFIIDTLATTRDDSKVRLFKIHQMEVVSLSSTLLVLKNEVERNANIYENFMLGRQASQLSFGECDLPNSQREAAKNTYVLPAEMIAM